jgi:hypothetical protein
MITPKPHLSPEMLEYRNHLQRLEQDAQVDYDKAILALSGGALGISFAFFRGVLEHSNTAHAGALFYAWICWGLSLACAFISFYTAKCALRAAIKEVDDGKTPPRFGGCYDKLTSFFNVAAGIFFLIGLIFATCFLYNLH